MSAGEDWRAAKAAVLDRLVNAVLWEGLVTAEWNGDRVRIGRFEWHVRQATATGRLALVAATEDPVAVWDVWAGLIPGDHAVVRGDLVESVRGYVLALEGARRRRTGLTGTTVECARREASPLVFFEQWVIDGHPLHPGSKIKLGLVDEEARAYSPEWGARVDVRLVVLPKERVVTSGERLTDLIVAEHPQVSVPEGHEVMPVHPWQAEHVLDERLLPVTIAARPLMNFRTLAPEPRPDLPFPSHLKTAVNIQFTGAVRGVSAHTAHNGPEVSRLLAEILRRENGFGRRLDIAAERAGSCDPALGGSLGAVVRANPEAGLTPGELAMPAAALYAASPTSEGAILGELLDGPSAAIAFAADYARVSVEPLLTLLTRYGVALEAHPQNVVLVMRDGMPVRLVVRDFGAIRINHARLARHGLQARVQPGSAISAASPAELRAKLYFSFFTNHLGEVLACAARATGVDQDQLWAPFVTEVRRVFAGLRDEPCARADAAALLDRPLPLKTVLEMRLTGAVTHERFTAVPNPMARSV